MTATGFADNGTLYFEAAGEGPPLVLSHAGFVDSRMWDRQWEDFTQRYRTIRYDLRGFGKSGPVSAETSRREDLRALLDALDVARAHLLGCSLGGEVSLDFALEHPERVASLILVSAVPGGFALQGEPPATLLEMLAAVQQGDVAQAAELQVRLWMDGPFRQPEAVDAAARREVAALARDALERGAQAEAEARPLDPPAVERLRELQVPTLIVVGALDDPEILRAADLMAAAIDGARLETIPDSAHLPSVDQPARFNRVVSGFLAAVR